MTLERIETKWLTARELAEQLKVSPLTVFRLAREGMPCVNISSAAKLSHAWKPRFSAKECVEWLKVSRKGGAR